MKRTVRATIHKVNGLTLTPLECKGLTWYYYLSTFCVIYMALHLNLNERLLEWLDYLSPEWIIAIAAILNTLLIMRAIEEFKKFIMMLFCKCE
jgi:hypothetical protein